MVNEKEMLIDFKDFFIFILRKWQIILIACVICALISGGYRALSFNDSLEDVYSEESRQALAGRLTETETKEVEDLFNRYLAYKKRIAYSDTHLSNSTLMKLNPESLPSLNVQYSIHSDRHNVSSFFPSQSLGISEYEKIAAVFGEDTDVASISEIISIAERPIGQDGMNLDIDSQNNLYVGSVDNSYSWVLIINVYAFDRIQCERIMDIAERAVNDRYQNLVDAGINVSMTKLGSNYTESTATWLADQQRANINEASTLKAEYDTFEKGTLLNFSSEEKRYFDFLKDRYEGKKQRRSLAKYCVIGGMTGLIAALFVIVLSYLTSSRVKNKSDYVIRSGHDDVLEVIYTPVRKKSVLNRLATKLINKVWYGIDENYDKNERSRIIARRIRQLCNRNNITELFIVDESSKKEAADTLSTISDELKNEGITVTCGKPLFSSADYDTYQNVKNVVFYGSFHDSKSEVLSDYLKLFDENQSVVLGSVLHGEL